MKLYNFNNWYDFISLYTKISRGKCTADDRRDGSGYSVICDYYINDNKKNCININNSGANSEINWENNRPIFRRYGYENCMKALFKLAEQNGFILVDGPEGAGDDF